MLALDAMDVTTVTLGAHWFEVLFDCEFNSETLFSAHSVINASGLRVNSLQDPR